MSNIAYLTEELRSAATDLPTSYETRWTNARKAAVVHAVQNGVISLDRALALYRMSPSEFESWRKICTPLEQPYSGLRQMPVGETQVARRDQPTLRRIL